MGETTDIESRLSSPVASRWRISWSRGVSIRASILRLGSVRYQDASLAVAFGINVGVYAGIVACFATGLFWLMQPTVVQNQGLAAYKPPPRTVVIYADPTWVPPTLSESPATVAVAEPAPEVVESTVVATKKEIKKRAARTTPPRERLNPFWDYASAPSRSFRPWF
jgi:hypothetical protein